MIVVGGYIGVEMADALTHRDIEVTLLQRARSLLPRTLDAPLGALVADELIRHGLRVLASTALEEIDRGDGELIVRTQGRAEIHADLVLVAAGVRPQFRAGRGGRPRARRGRRDPRRSRHAHQRRWRLGGRRLRRDLARAA